MKQSTYAFMTSVPLTILTLLSACSGPADKSTPLSSPAIKPTSISEAAAAPAGKSAARSTAVLQELESLDIAIDDWTLPASPELYRTDIRTDNRSDSRLDNRFDNQINTERYQTQIDNPVLLTAMHPVSTFSIDVDTGSYANVRRFLNNGQLPPHDAVRSEEMVNYFNYSYPQPDNSDIPFQVNTELSVTPWNNNTRLLHIGLKGYVPRVIENSAANLVFLIDVSGSMNSPDKLGLLKTSLKMMTAQLDEHDHVSIVVYAGASGVVLEPTPGNQQRQINAALERLQAGGSTNGQAGIEIAYALAGEHYVEGGVNRVILATDGDFNVGISDINTLKTLIANKRKSGIALTTLGFGSGNYNDHLMEQLADTGNGNYAYIDTLNEAKKVLVDELDATLINIAHDVKIQLEFNPAVVSEYRLVGYVNRALKNEDFNNDRVDAGDIGAGHTVTALYELAIVGDGGEQHTPRRYGKPTGTHNGTHSNTDNGTPAGAGIDLNTEIGELRLRYKLPDEQQSQLLTEAILTEDLVSADATSNAYRFSAGVAAFAQLLRQSTQIGDYMLEDAAELARSGLGEDTNGYRAELLRLIGIADSLATIEQASEQRNRESSNG